MRKLTGRQRIAALLFLVSVQCWSPAIAETMYVTDILRLGLHQNSDTSGTAFRTLVSGDELEILQRSRYYAQVRTRDGAEGWVKASYLIDEKPAQSMLAELTLERDDMSNELAGVSARLEEIQVELRDLRTDRNRLGQTAATLNDELAALRTDNVSLNQKVAAFKFSVPIHWLVGIAVLTLAGGFLGGWWWTDARQRKRHGGFRI